MIATRPVPAPIIAISRPLNRHRPKAHRHASFSIMPERRPPPSSAPPTAPKRVLLCTYGSLGDLHPFLAIALGLRARGHDAVIASHPSYRERVERLGLGFRPVRPDLPDPERDPAAMARVMDPRVGAEEVFRHGVLPSLRAAYDDTLAAASGVDLLVSHTLTMTVPLVAATTGIPWASVILQPLTFFSAHDFPVLAPAPYLAKLRRLGPPANRALVAGMRRTLNRWLTPWRQLRADLGLPPTDANPILDGQHAPALVLALFSRHFALPQPDWPPQTVQTGFPFLDPDQDGDTPLPPELAAFLDAGPPPLVFTLGSAAVMAAGDFYAASAATAARLVRRAVLVVGDDPRNLADLRALPPDILAVPYAPYAALFPRAAAIVHQGGIGTTAEALRAGRPMLVMPYGHDQPDNADRVARLGVGRAIPRRSYTPSRAATELDRLLNAPSVERRAAALGDLIRAEDGADAAAAALERLLSP